MKLAIKVENQNEQIVLLKHYESKGWTDYNGDSPLQSEPWEEDMCYDYHDGFGWNTQENQEADGYEVITFKALRLLVDMPIEIDLEDDYYKAHVYPDRVEISDITLTREDIINLYNLLT